MNDWLKDLDTDPMAAKNEEIRKTAHIANGGEGTALRTCPKCGGRGVRTYGYVNIQSYPCGWCRQTGKVSDKREANIARAIKAETTRQRNVDAKREAFYADNEDVVRFIHRNAEWSNFYRSMQETLATKGELSENQLAAVKRGMGEAEKRAAERRAAREASAVAVDISAIEALFETARSNGLKKMAFRTDRLHVSPAPATGRNAGALYVKDNGEYAGKIVGGKFQALRTTAADVSDLLKELAADPAGVSRFYGRKTGVCCCCGKELTDPASVEAGIGPVCATKWEL